MPNGNSHPQQTVRIGLFSRIDFGSLGWRRGLLELAAKQFHDQDVHFVVLVGGLVAGRAVADRARQLKSDHRLNERKIKSLSGQLLALEDKLEQLRSRKLTDTVKGRIEKLALAITKLNGELDDCRRLRRHIGQQQESLQPENMAAALAKQLPAFTNRAGERVKLYIVPSPAYDREVGIETARILAEQYNTGGYLRLLKAGADRLPLHIKRTFFASLELLTPEKAAWMRGDYFSTPVERVIKDKRRQTSLAKTPDFSVVGGFGSLIVKPRGESIVPYIAVPVLHRIEETTVNENQIGVLVMEVTPHVSTPTVHSFPFKDRVSQERAFIGRPSGMDHRRAVCIDVLRTYGPRTTGMLCDLTTLSREHVMEALSPLVVKRGDRPRKTWPGLEYDEKSGRWDFNFDWIRHRLNYPEPNGEHRVDELVGFACLHAGSHDTDYEHFLREVPRVIIERQSNILIGAGDFVEGLAHNMMMRGELYAGLNLTDQERLAGKMIAQVMLTTFRHRFELLLAGTELDKLTPARVAELVDQALIKFIYIPGNHDLWDAYSGHEPLVTMVDTIIRQLTGELEKILVSKNLRIDFLAELIANKVVTSPDGQFILPSGLQMSVQHPHMARAKTTSLRPQEMLAFAADCQVVIGANFHVGEHVEQWDSDLGQRCCVQIGTIKHGSPFERGKLKVVDQGFAWLRVESVGHRIVRTASNFISHERATRKRLDPRQPFYDFCRKIGL